jgi:hypothetical protein
MRRTVYSYVHISRICCFVPVHTYARAAALSPGEACISV